MVGGGISILSWFDMVYHSGPRKQSAHLELQIFGILVSYLSWVLLLFGRLMVLFKFCRICMQFYYGIVDFPVIKYSFYNHSFRITWTYFTYFFQCLLLFPKKTSQTNSNWNIFPKIRKSPESRIYFIFQIISSVFWKWFMKPLPWFQL